jgi:hypothetical protein
MLPNLEIAKNTLVELHHYGTSLINLSHYLAKKEDLTAAHLDSSKIYIIALAIFDIAIAIGSTAALAPYSPISAIWLIGSGALIGIIKTYYEGLNDDPFSNLFHVFACLTPKGKILYSRR